MPRYRLKRYESGDRYTTIEVVADSRDAAASKFLDGEGTIVSQYFKQLDLDILSLEEVEDVKD